TAPLPENSFQKRDVKGPGNLMAPPERLILVGKRTLRLFPWPCAAPRAGLGFHEACRIAGAHGRNRAMRQGEILHRAHFDEARRGPLELKSHEPFAAR